MHEVVVDVEIQVDVLLDVLEVDGLHLVLDARHRTTTSRKTWKTRSTSKSGSLYHVPLDQDEDLFDVLLSVLDYAVQVLEVVATCSEIRELPVLPPPQTTGAGLKFDTSSNVLAGFFPAGAPVLRRAGSHVPLSWPMPPAWTSSCLGAAVGAFFRTLFKCFIT